MKRQRREKETEKEKDNRAVVNAIIDSDDQLLNGLKDERARTIREIMRCHSQRDRTFVSFFYKLPIELMRLILGYLSDLDVQCPSRSFSFDFKNPFMGRENRIVDAYLPIFYACLQYFGKDELMTFTAAFPGQTNLCAPCKSRSKDEMVGHLVTMLHINIHHNPAISSAKCVSLKIIHGRQSIRISPADIPESDRILFLNAERTLKRQCISWMQSIISSTFYRAITDARGTNVGISYFDIFPKADVMKRITCEKLCIWHPK